MSVRIPPAMIMLVYSRLTTLHPPVNSVNKLDPSIQLDYSAFKPYGDPKVQLKDIWGIYAQKYW